MTALKVTAVFDIGINYQLLMDTLIKLGAYNIEDEEIPDEEGKKTTFRKKEAS